MGVLRKPGARQLQRRSLRSLWLLLLLAMMSAATLGAIFRTSSLSSMIFRQPFYQDFLFLSIAALSFLLGQSLREEARRTAHPAICSLETGFFAQAALFAGQTALGEIFPAAFNTVSALHWFGAVYSLWVAQFAAAAALAIAWPQLRRRVRDWAGSCAPLRQATWIWFAAFATAGLAGAYFFPNSAPVAWSFGISIALGLAALAAGSAVYFRRRRPMILPLITGLLVFLLARTSAFLGEPWQLLWWYSYLMYFGGLMLIAHGVTEGDRVREREELIGRLEELTAQLEEQSIRDPLTGAYNRRHMMNQLEAEFKRAVRGRLPLTLLVCDLDRFKDINDNYGHPCGDFVLKEITRRLADNGRQSDVVGRCGGEEFWVLLPQTNRVGGQGVAAKLLEIVREPMMWEDRVLNLTMSVGIADTLSPGARDVAALIHEADRALYMAKRSGKDRAMALDPLSFTVPGK